MARKLLASYYWIVVIYGTLLPYIATPIIKLAMLIIHVVVGIAYFAYWRIKGKCFDSPKLPSEVYLHLLVLAVLVYIYFGPNILFCTPIE